MDKRPFKELEGLDQDRPDRYRKNFRWYPDREHKTERTGGATDCFADESFYSPLHLGRAEVEPAVIPAGDVSPLTIRYICGREPVPAGASVRFYMRGQQTLGCRFQCADPALPGYITVKGPQTCTLTPVPLGFRVDAGSLTEGDLVELTAGQGEGFTWTPLADRYEFKTVLDFGEDVPERRLPEPLVIRVLPREARRLEVTVPATAPEENAPLRLHVTARDAFDNRALLQGALDVEADGKRLPLHMADGLAGCLLPPGVGIPQGVTVTHRESGLSAGSNPCVPTGGLQLYFGDLHVHDFLSEAHQYTDKVYRWAREDRNLDFVSVSIQTHGWIDNEKWTVVKYMNERYLEEGRFVTLLANEWQHSAFGDKVIHHLGGDQPFLCVDDPRYNSAPKLYETLRGGEAVVISHHAAYPKMSWCSSTNFDAVETDVERLTELWSMHGSSEGFEETDRPLAGMDPANTAMAALRRGLRLGFVGGSDTHSGRPGGSAREPMGYWGGLACVWAPSLTRRDIFAALRARRTYAVTGARIVLKMTVNGAFMGSELPPCDTAHLEIEAWAPAEIAKVQIIKNGELLTEIEAGGLHRKLSLEDETGGSAFYHCRVVQQDGHLAVCSPVWIG